MNRFALAAGFAITAGVAVAQPQPGLNQAIESEVEQNIRRQPIGSHTVNELGLSDELVRRFRDRVIRSSFEDRNRIVVRDAGGPSTPVLDRAMDQAAAPPPPPAAPAAGPPPPPPPSPLPWFIGAGVVIVIATLAVVLRRGKA